jgi:glycosyltransferase involved in cell wall biosynthesis
METRLRVLFDGYWWGHGPVSNRTVQRELIRHWCEHFPDDNIVVAVRAGATELDDLPTGVEVTRTRLWPHGLSNALELARLARRTKSDVVITHNYAALGFHTVVFIHDVMFVEHPEWFSRSERLYFAGMLPLARMAARTGRLSVVTSSQSEADRITRLAPQLAPVSPVGLAINPGLLDAQVSPHDIRPDLDFAVTVGRLNVRKNLGDLLDAAGLSRKVSPHSPLLVVGGMEHSGLPPTLSDAQRALVEDGSVRFLGHVSDANLAWLYSHAQVFASLSRDEGFGLTPLEAHALGAPVVVSDIPSHRETVGDHATLVRVGSPPAITAAAIDTAWGQSRETPDIPEDLQRYSWRSCVERLRAAALQRVKV